MPLLTLLEMLLIIAIVCKAESAGKRNKPFTKQELDEISMRIVGKSQKEVRKILNEYK